MKYSITKISQDNADSFFTKEGLERASAVFSRIRFGQKPTPRTPLYKDVPEDEVFEMWVEQLDRILEVSNKSPNDEGYLGDLIQYDKSRTVKVGPQGELKPLDDRMDDILQYWTLPINIDRDIDMDIIDNVRNILFGIDPSGKRNLIRPMSVERVVSLDKYDNKLVTNSGCPDFGKRNDPAILSRAMSDAELGIWKNYPMALGARSQRGKERSIFMAPFSLNIKEKQFLYPLLEIIRNRNIPFFSAWEGFKQVELGFAEQNFFNNEESLLIQQDYTSMDKFYNETCNDIVKLVCSSVFQENYRDDFNEVVDHLTTVPVLISTDKMIEGRHGMPSGSGFTNFNESIVSYYYSHWLNKYKLNVNASQGLGDDLAFEVPTTTSQSNDNEDYSDIAQLLSTSSEQAAGLVVEPTKQRIDRKTTVYLQRFFDKRIREYDEGMEIVVGCYPSILALNTAINPERYHDPRKWSGEMETLRWLMILENCYRLPYFPELVAFFVKGDKFKLGLNIPGFFDKLPIIFDEAKAIKGFVPTYNQESMDKGILDFNVVKYLLRNRSELE
uniref:RdRp n=1 Tax=viral metagenome TaxID=1070528 RepID=A0A2V0RCJ1_9ZZZZ